MKISLSAALLFTAVLSSQNCSETSPSTAQGAVDKAMPVGTWALPSGFNAYWYAGKAEICTYDVVQERYGETHQAEQVNVFVTEDFSRAKQVKLDDAAAAGADRVPVLKLNAIRRFHTGIYDYSIMQSVFVPVSGARALKTSTTVQDWCGHVFMQCNLVPDGYRLRGFSYFESEGDQDQHLPPALLEDELWARIRLQPSALPIGKTDLIPSSVYARLRHRPNEVQVGDCQVEKGETESVFSVRYAQIPRTLRIRFETAFPHRITGWEEQDKQTVSSKGTLKATRQSAYWAEHDPRHAPLRDSLQLRF